MGRMMWCVGWATEWVFSEKNPVGGDCVCAACSQLLGIALPTGVGYACAYGVFWSFRKGLAMGWMKTCIGLGGGVDLGETESSGWWCW